MAVRKAYIDWNRFGPDTKLESGKKYMVCPVDGDTCDIRFATYYDAGTVIRVGLTDEAGAGIGPERTAEEKLLSALFGRAKAFAVPEDGFYVLTADYGVDADEYNGAFRDCREQPVCVGNRYGWEEDQGAVPAYWAEVPVLPEGLRLSSEDPAPGGPSGWLAGKVREAEEKLEGDPIAAAVWEYVMDGHGMGDGPIEYKMAGAVYALSPVWLAAALVDVHAACVAMSRIPEGELLEFRRALEEADGDVAVKAAGEFCGLHGLERNMCWLLFEYIRYLTDGAGGFYYYRDRALRAGGTRSLNLPAVLQEALGMSKVRFRLARCVKLEVMGAPQVILVNELRCLIEYVAMARLGDRIVRVSPDFDIWYGVRPDGSRGDRKCEYGDRELAMLPGPDGDEDEAEPEPESEPKVIGVDYPWFAGVEAPDFLMRKYRYVIWDNSAFRYVRGDDGKIEGYDSFPRERLAELNAAASEGRH